MKLKTRGYQKSSAGYRSIITKVHESDVRAIDRKAKRAGVTRSEFIRQAAAKAARIRGGATSPVAA